MFANWSLLFDSPLFSSEVRNAHVTIGRRIIENDSDKPNMTTNKNTIKESTTSRLTTLTPEMPDCNRLDADNNDVINIIDLSIFAQEYTNQCRDRNASPHCEELDINNDGIINASDLEAFKMVYLETCLPY